MTTAPRDTQAGSVAALLRDRELRALTRDVMAPGATEPFGAYLFTSDEPGADLGRHVERSVFFQAFGDTPEVMAGEYASWEPTSFFICVIDHLRAVPAGMMRVIVPSARGLKTFEDIERIWGVSVETLARDTNITLDPMNTWDIATLAIDPGYRTGAVGGLVGMGLYQTIALAARGFDVRWVVAVFDMPVFKLLRLKLRMMFEGFAGLEPMPYLGSPASIPAWCDVLAAERYLAERDPDLHAIMERGVGLEAGLRRVDFEASEPFLAMVTESRLRAVVPQTPVSSRRWVAKDATTSGNRALPTGRE